MRLLDCSLLLNYDLFKDTCLKLVELNNRNSPVAISEIPESVRPVFMDLVLNKTVIRKGNEVYIFLEDYKNFFKKIYQ